MSHFQKSIKYSFLPVLLAVFTYLIITTYEGVKKQATDNFNSDQLLLASQAAKGIESFFTYYLTELTFLATIDYVINLDDNGDELLSNFYENHADQIEAVTRVDSEGRILFTAPEKPQAIGTNISSQEHVKKVLETHQAVVSEVFFAVQGYQTVAYHIPVFDNGVFKGSLAILIPIKKLSSIYLANIKMGESGRAWMLSKKGIELYCPFEEHIGKSVEETSGEYPSVMEMVKELMKGGEGKYTYNYYMPVGDKREPVTKLAVYYPVNLGNTFWSIIIATPEDEVYSNLIGFRNRMSIIFAVIFLVSLIYFYSFIKAWKIVKEEKKRKLAEQALRQSEHLLRKVAENYPNSYVSIIEKDMTIGFTAGKEFAKRELNSEKLIGMKISEVYGEKSNMLIDNFQKTFQGEEQTFEFYDEGEYHLYNCVPLIKADDNIIKILVVSENITERKLAEELIKRNLKEKEVLLKEIHHRVKNNLNVIVSLLDLQAGEIKNEFDAKEACRESIDRIKSIALVHERLYQSVDYSQIEFSEYIYTVISELKNIYDINNRILIEYQLDEAVIDIGKAIPCGLILNELTTNALKHAFAGKGDGKIIITFNKLNDTEYTMIVEDNGKGLTEDFSINDIESLGLSLVRILTQQIDGVLKISKAKGTRFEVTFPA